MVGVYLCFEDGAREDIREEIVGDRTGTGEHVYVLVHVGYFPQAFGAMRTFPAMTIVSPAEGGTPIMRVNAFTAFDHDGDLVSGFTDELAFRFFRLFNVEFRDLIEELRSFGTPVSLFTFRGFSLELFFQGLDVLRPVESEDSFGYEVGNILACSRDQFHGFRSIALDQATIKLGVGIDNLIGDQVGFGGVGSNGGDDELHGGVPFD